jgi:hypothetical protein
MQSSTSVGGCGSSKLRRKLVQGGGRMEISADGGKAERQAADWAAARTAPTCAGVWTSLAEWDRENARLEEGGRSLVADGAQACNTETAGQDSKYLMVPWFRFEPGALWGPHANGFSKPTRVQCLLA